MNRKVILFIACSLDGYIAGPNHEIDWLFTDHDYGYTPFFSGVDTVVMGRKTWMVSRSFSAWPFGDTAVYVFSHSMSVVAEDHITIVKEEPSTLINRLRELPGENIWLVGGGDLIRQFLQADLIDEFVISIHPILLGGGVPLFPAGFPPTRLSTVNSRAFRSGLIQTKLVRIHD